MKETTDAVPIMQHVWIRITLFRASVKVASLEMECPAQVGDILSGGISSSQLQNISQPN